MVLINGNHVAVLLLVEKIAQKVLLGQEVKTRRLVFPKWPRRVGELVRHVPTSKGRLELAIMLGHATINA